MGLFSKETPEKLERRLEKVTLEEEVYNHEANIAERKAVIKQLDREYGSGWTKVLGVSKLTDLSTLKSFLSGAKRGIAKEGHHTAESKIGQMATTIPKMGAGGSQNV